MHSSHLLKHAPNISLTLGFFFRESEIAEFSTIPCNIDVQSAEVKRWNTQHNYRLNLGKGNKYLCKIDWETNEFLSRDWINNLRMG